MYMYVRQAYFNKKLMLMSRMIDDNLVSLSKIDSVTITVENHHLVTVCTPNAYGSKGCVYGKRARHQVWIILNKRLMTKVLLFVGHPIQMTIVVTH